MDFISDMLRNVFIFIDSIVYGFIGSVYELLMDIAATNIFGDNTIMKFADRVYALIAVFMLFRLSFSVLTYIINPDTANDKSAGGGKLISNVLITIVLLISVPWAFRQVLAIQNDILKDNIIGKIILGTSDSLSSSMTTQFDAGDTMAWTTFSAFFYPNETKCPDGWNTDCKDKLNEVKVNEIGVGDSYERVEKSQLVSGIQKSGLITARIPGSNDERGVYAFEYSSIIATLGGAFIVYILILFCIQIAVRSVKLGVLQLIAPIPIISYIDPKQSKNGMFSKWLKLCGKTFADLFIRLAAIYFAIFIIMEITHGDGMINSLTGQKASGLVKVLIILGALTFAKDLPKFIEEITGIKLDGGFSLNPMKSLASVPLVGGGLVAGMGIVGAGALAAGRLGSGVMTSGTKAAIHKISGGRYGESFKSGMATSASRAGMRMRAGLDAAGSNWRNIGGDGKYTSSKEKYKSLTEDYSKGTKAFKEIDKNWKRGQKAEQELIARGMSFSDFDGYNKAAYSTVYNHDEFKNSLMNLDKQDAINKQFTNALYEAQTLGDSWGGTTIDGVNYTKNDLSTLKKNAEASQKALAGLEKVHDTMRQKYGDDAKIQDGIKAKKYNATNPTGR